MILEQEFFYHSPLGVLEINLKKDQIYSISKVQKIKKKSSLDFFSLSTSKHGKNKHLSKSMNLVLSFLDDYFSGKKVKGGKLPLFSRGTVFQKKVWKYLKKIPYGKTYTYIEVAKAVGFPKAARAVGSACARNPYLILVPCHRIVAQRGLGGFALGLSAKKWLLNHELSLRS